MIAETSPKVHRKRLVSGGTDCLPPVRACAGRALLFARINRLQAVHAPAVGRRAFGRLHRSAGVDVDEPSEGCAAHGRVARGASSDGPGRFVGWNGWWCGQPPIDQHSAAAASRPGRRGSSCTLAVRPAAMLAHVAIATLQLLVTCVCISAQIVTTEISQQPFNISATLDSLQQGYDKRLRPNYGGPPVDVGITMHVVSISSLSEVQMDFTIDFFFRQMWRDHRLSYPDHESIQSLTIGTDYIKNMWVPDTYFPNEKTSYYHVATASNEFLRIQPTGDILRSIRLTITASCPMHLQYFPMDRQMCELEIESFGYATADITYIWKGDNPVKIDKTVQLPQFVVKGHKTDSILFVTSTGNYSRLKLAIQFERSMGYYLIQMYVPSDLIVVISWVSFWLNRNATPARVALGVTTVLTMTTLMSSTNAALPKISYIKAIDVYLGYCFVMVFASLLEYAYVGYIGKRIGMRKNRYMAMQKMLEQRSDIQSRAHSSVMLPSDEPQPVPKASGGYQSSKPYMSHTATLRRGHTMHSSAYHGHAYQGHATPTPHEPREQHTCHLQEVRYKVHDPKVHSKGAALENTVNGARGGDEESGNISAILCNNKKLDTLLGCSPSDVDKYSRIVFPVSFICFNLMYWIIYLHVSDEQAEDLIPFKIK